MVSGNTGTRKCTITLDVFEEIRDWMKDGESREVGTKTEVLLASLIGKLGLSLKETLVRIMD